MEKIKTKLTDEPVIVRQIVGLILSGILVAMAFGLDLSDEQFKVLEANLPTIVGALVTAIMGVTSVSARSKVSVYRGE